MDATFWHNECIKFYQFFFKWLYSEIILVKYYQYNSMHYNSVLNYTLLNNTTFGGHQVIKFFNIGNSDIAYGHAQKVEILILKK
jgi:hypothetical protein